MRAVVIALTGLSLSTAAYAAATTDNNSPVAPGSIIWNDGPAANNAPNTGASAGAPDRNGIIWDAPGSAPSARSPAPSTPPPGSGAGLSPKRESIIWDTPAQASNAAKPFVPPPPTTSAQANATCREFQTSIVIDGVRQPAHGTACRQADGSWRVTR